MKAQVLLSILVINIAALGASPLYAGPVIPLVEDTSQKTAQHSVQTVPESESLDGRLTAINREIRTEEKRHRKKIEQIEKELDRIRKDFGQ